MRTTVSVLAAAGRVLHAGTLFTLRRSNSSHGVCFCGPTDAFPYLSLCLTQRIYGCSVCRCCRLEPHESWTQKGLSVLCWVRFRDPLEHMKVSEAEKRRSKPQRSKHVNSRSKPEVASCQDISDEEVFKGSYCEKLDLLFVYFFLALLHVFLHYWHIN